MTLAALLLFAAWLLLPPPAQAQRGVFVDPNTPAGREYAIPLEDARRKAAPGEEQGGGGGRAGGGDPPLFGTGITRAPGASAAGSGSGGNGGDGELGGNPRDRPVSSEKSDAAETPEALETTRNRGSSLAVEAAASGGSDTLVSAGIAGLVLAGGLAVGFVLRRLLRSE